MMQTMARGGKVKGMARGGHVKHMADGGYSDDDPQRELRNEQMQQQRSLAQQQRNEPHISMPVSTAARMARGLTQAGALAGAKMAVSKLTGAGAPAPSGMPSAPQPQSTGIPMPRQGTFPGGAMPGSQSVPAMAKGGRLTAAQRRRMPADEFALPGGRYPINDANHARNALARVSQNGTPSEQARVRAAVHRKYPDIGRK